MTNDGRLKITTSKDELPLSGLTYEKLNWKDTDTKKFLENIIKRGKEATGFNPKGKLQIEVYPGNEIVIYATEIKPAKEPLSEIDQAIENFWNSPLESRFANYWGLEP